jgi:hypothetical protein
LRLWLIDSPLQLITNAIGIFGSPTKGLRVYAPVLIASFYAVPRAYRTHREIVIFALLIVMCTMGLICLLVSRSDEVCGCRYLHLAIAPLILCMGAAWPHFRWQTVAPLAILAIVGLSCLFSVRFTTAGCATSP